MSRRRPDTAYPLTIKVVCTHDAVETVVTRVRIRQSNRDAGARKVAPRSTATTPEGTVQIEPLDDWSGGVVTDPMPNHRRGGSPQEPGQRVQLRCPRPGCRSTLRLSPERADWVIDKLLHGDVSRVELSHLAAILSKSNSPKAGPA